jgi:hypothetical protein
MNSAKKNPWLSAPGPFAKWGEDVWRRAAIKRLTAEAAYGSSLRQRPDRERGEIVAMAGGDPS